MIHETDTLIEQTPVCINIYMYIVYIIYKYYYTSVYSVIIMCVHIIIVLKAAGTGQHSDAVFCTVVVPVTKLA